MLAARTLMPDGAGDLWSLAMAALCFVVLLSLLKGLDRI